MSSRKLRETSVPVIAQPFLTLPDPRARVKGSRDPLGLQPLWTRLGRQVVRNLTTVTTSLRGFTVLLLGYYFAELAEGVEEAGKNGFAEHFLKFEQIAAYSRVALARRSGGDFDEDEIRGIQRVKERLSSGTANASVVISAAPKHQILGNQKTYGLWGLYSVAARNSGWLESNVPRLTSSARQFIEDEYVPRIERRGDSVADFLKKDRRFEPFGRHVGLAQTLAHILGPSLTYRELEFYTRHLIDCGPDDVQRTLWKRIRQLNRPERFDLSELRALIKICRSSGDADLTEHLEHIYQIETVIGPAGRLFGFALLRNRQTLDKIAREVKSVWGDGLPHIDQDAFEQSLSTTSDYLTIEERSRLVKLAEALASGHFQEAIRLALARNESVMRARGSGPWAILDGRTIAVRLPEETHDLPAKRELHSLWENTYFINALKTVGLQIERGSPA